MSDAWEDIQALKSKRITYREKVQKRKKEREGILNFELASDVPRAKVPKDFSVVASAKSQQHRRDASEKEVDLKKYPEVEDILLNNLCDVTLSLPVDSETLHNVLKDEKFDISEQVVINFLQKFATQGLITVKNDKIVVNADHAKLAAMVEEKQKKQNGMKSSVDLNAKEKKDTTDIMSLISMPTIKEKETKKVGEEILDLLSKPTAKERSLAERFRSQGGAQVMEFCPHGTRNDCKKNSSETCHKLHFKKIIQAHTDESLGDCSFLNTCFHMDTCKYVHYEVDNPGMKTEACAKPQRHINTGTVLYPPQWIQCDLRIMDMSVLGKFSVIMADPPWDIHMELPYGTMSDDEMRQLGVPQLQDEGLIFLWVTGRAMELGRECLKLWGYDRVDELIWVKTNQLQRIIRTGRTGHWLNHGKEHCLVGLKGDMKHLNRGLDCDVIVAEVRATSHKPDEIYGIIERLSPGTRKIELFGRPHNVQPNWITLGNQVDGVRLIDPELIEAFRKAYPDGNAMLPPTKHS